MPTRFIKESCRTSKNLQACSDFAERLFWRLLTTADDFGRCLACPSIVRGVCFPHHEKLKLEQVQKGLMELRDNDLLVLYCVGDRDYAEFVTFSTHQGKPRAKISKYPEKTIVYVPLHADASRCMQMHADAGEYGSTPNTDTEANTNTNTKEGIVKGGGKTAFPLDWKPSEVEMQQWRDHGLQSPHEEFATFKDHALTNDRRCKDWVAAWRNWCRKSLRIKEERANGLYKVRS